MVLEERMSGIHAFATGFAVVWNSHCWMDFSSAQAACFFDR
jgi:hypothetical protein